MLMKANQSGCKLFLVLKMNFKRDMPIKEKNQLSLKIV